MGKEDYMFVRNLYQGGYTISNKPAILARIRDYQKKLKEAPWYAWMERDRLRHIINDLKDQLAKHGHVFED